MKKALDIIRRIFVAIVVCIAVAMMIFTIVSVNTFNRNDRDLFGYKAFIVLSDSMSKTDFDAGDLIFVKEVEDYSSLKAGDIISYTSQSFDNYGETITHKIRKAAEDEHGNPGFITYGTTTDTDDEKVVTYPYIIGQYQFNIPKIGTFFNYIKTVPGYLMCIFLPFFILILSQGLNCIKLFKKYKEEQLEAIEGQKKELEKEREKSKEMMQELMELKKQLGNKLFEDVPDKESAEPEEIVQEEAETQEAEAVQTEEAEEVIENSEEEIQEVQA